MPRLKHSPPKYRLHKPSGRAVVTIAGKDHYLGEFNSDESHKAYDRVVAEWLQAGRPSAKIIEDESDCISIAAVLVLFLRHAKEYYRASDEYDGFKYAVAPLTRLYSRLPADQFTPKKLKAVREEMVKQGMSRTYINKQIGRIRMVFKWAVSEELVSGSVLHALQAVTAIKHGRRGDVRESAPIKPIADEIVDQTLHHMPLMVADMVRIQRLTGMRPGELLRMRGCDLDTSGKVWTYSPPKHKTAHHGHTRTIYLGPKAQEILMPYLRRVVTEFLFQPAESEQQRLMIAHQQRKTPLSCGNKPGSNRVRGRERAPGERYDGTAYRQAIQRACDRTFPPSGTIARNAGESLEQWKLRIKADPKLKAALAAWRRQHRWHPHQLRHTAATQWRKDHGSEHVLTLLGDRSSKMIDVYAERDEAAAIRIAAACG